MVRANGWTDAGSTHLTATLPAKSKQFTAWGLAVSGFDEETEAIGPTMPTPVGMLHALTTPTKNRFTQS
jgi:hypothetical protein